MLFVLVENDIERDEYSLEIEDDMSRKEEGKNDDGLTTNDINSCINLPCFRQIS